MAGYKGRTIWGAYNEGRPTEKRLLKLVKDVTCVVLPVPTCDEFCIPGDCVVGCSEQTM